MLKIGEYTPAHDGQPAFVDKEYYRQGYIFKDEDAFLNRPDDVCYIPEFADDDEGYTAKDIIELCRGDAEYAKDIFYRLDWQHPSTLIDEDDIYADKEEICMTTEEKMGTTDMSNILDAIEKRSSTRGYQPEKLTDWELDALVKAGLQAPTAASKQEIHITVVDGSNPILMEIEVEKNALAGIQAPAANFYYSAPTVLILSGDKAFPWSALDAGIAVENIALAAEGLGLKFPNGYEFEIAIAVGHKAKGETPHEYNAEKNVSRI